MINYASMKLENGVRPFDVHDIISDVAQDLHGLSFTLDAIADWGGCIEPTQLHPISAALFMASEALRQVNKTVDTFTYEGKKVSND